MGKPAARIGDMHVCPMYNGKSPHVGGPVAIGDATVLIGGVPAARIGDMCTCMGPPDTIAMGSAAVLIGGKPAARMGDSTAHGGKIVVGLPTVLIGEAGGGLVIAPMSIVLVQIQALVTAAKNGTPFCEKCAAAAAAREAAAKSPQAESNTVSDKSAPQSESKESSTKEVQKTSPGPQSEFISGGSTSTDANEAQRAKAIRILKQCPKCSCGDIMLGPVKALYWAAEEGQSGKIGDHYEQVIDKLMQPATLERLRAIADKETEFWRSKDGTPLGAKMPAEARYQILKAAFLVSGCWLPNI